MAITIELELSDAQVDGICAQRRYQATVPDPAGAPGATKPNPQTKAEFVESAIRSFAEEEAVAGIGQSRAAARHSEDEADRNVAKMKRGKIKPVMDRL